MPALSIADVIQRDALVSTEANKFSNPTEILAHVNKELDADFTSRHLSRELQRLGWTPSMRMVKRNGRNARYYYFKSKNKKLLIAPRKGGELSVDDGTESQSLAEIDRDFKLARAQKEAAIAKIRQEEAKTAERRRQHEVWQFERDEGKYIETDIHLGFFEHLIATIRTNFQTIPLKYHARWASITDENELRIDVENALNEILDRLSKGGVVYDSEKKEFVNREIELRF